MLWSDSEGRFHLYFYVGVFRSEETKTTSNLACVCERHLWEYLKRIKQQDLPNDIVLIADRWIKISSLKKQLFFSYISNHYTFQSMRVVSPLLVSTDFKLVLDSLDSNSILFF